MTDRPILFKNQMVRALLDGRKTQTRRVLKPQPPADMGLVGIYAPKLTAVFGYATPDADHKIALRYMPGDRLWVRENIGRRVASFMGIDATNGVEEAFYVADGSDVLNEHQFNVCPWWKRNQTLPGIHMPRWASRLTLTVTDVRVQRLQEISEADARAEGVLWVPGHGEITAADLHEGYSNYLNCREGFQVLWDSINAKHGFGWDSNPWIVCISFETHRMNIDQMEAQHVVAD